MNISTDYDQPDGDDSLAAEQVFESWAAERINPSPRLYTHPSVLYVDYIDWLADNGDDNPASPERFRSFLLDTFPSRVISGEEVVGVSLKPEPEPEPHRHGRRIR